MPARRTIPKVHIAREFRRAPTPSEKALWQALRHHKLCGAHFRRQHPVGPFIVDFCCLQHRLVLEVDGPIHDDQTEPDAERQALIEGHGYTVLRFSDTDVESDMRSVLTRIEQFLVINTS